MPPKDLIGSMTVLIEKMRQYRARADAGDCEGPHGGADDVMEEAVKILTGEFPSDHPVHALVGELLIANEFEKWYA